MDLIKSIFIGNARSYDQLGLLRLNQINLAGAKKTFEKFLQYSRRRKSVHIKKHGGFH
jgi:hypothetical protein